MAKPYPTPAVYEHDASLLRAPAGESEPVPASLELDDCSQGLPLLHILAEDAAVAALLVVPPECQALCMGGGFLSPQHRNAVYCPPTSVDAKHWERNISLERIAFLYVEEPTVEQIIGGVARI